MTSTSSPLHIPTMRKPQFKEINGHKYACTMMSVRKAHQTWIELVGTLGQPVVSAIARASDEPDQQAANLIPAVMSMAMMNLQGEVADRLLVSVFDGVRVEGFGELKPWDDQFDDHFRGRIFAMYKVWAWAVQVNYQDFLDEAQSLGLGQMVTKGKAALQTHLTQTSESGDQSSPSSSPELDS